MSELHSIERQIAIASRELGNRRDLHGSNSASYRTKRAELADLKQRRWAIKCDIAERVSRMEVMA